MERSAINDFLDHEEERTRRNGGHHEVGVTIHKVRYEVDDDQDLADLNRFLSFMNCDTGSILYKAISQEMIFCVYRLLDRNTSNLYYYSEEGGSVSRIVLEDQVKLRLLKQYGVTRRYRGLLTASGFISYLRHTRQESWIAESIQRLIPTPTHEPPSNIITIVSHQFIEGPENTYSVKVLVTRIDGGHEWISRLILAERVPRLWREYTEHNALYDEGRWNSAAEMYFLSRRLLTDMDINQTA